MGENRIGGSTDERRVPNCLEGVAGLRWKGIEFSVRENHRARRVILRVSSAGLLDVVVPRRFNRRGLPEIFQHHQDWIHRELQEARQEPIPSAPGQIRLNAIGESWRVDYRDGLVARIASDPELARVLTVDRDSNQVEAIAADLTSWLHRMARAHLAPWLREVSDEMGIPFEKTSVRGQTTRWASCSRLKNISLNRSLLFLPPHLVRHVFLHELCHIKQLNHSPSFWRLLHDMEPNTRALEAELKKGNQYVPAWVSVAKSRWIKQA